MGSPRIGGPISLIDHNARPFDSTTLKDTFLLIYFGFTHCPDVCPEELDKITSIMNLVETSVKDTNLKVQPLFITVDPERDGPSEIREYLKDFHPKMLGLTGPQEAVKEIARKFRVYFRPAKTSGNAEESMKATKDYLIDHSIFIFLMDPDGNYLTHFGRESRPERCAKIIHDAIESWDYTQ